MKTVSQLAHLWTYGTEGDDLPEGIEIQPFVPESGRATSRSKGIVHTVREAVIITDGTATRMVATWACGGTSVDTIEIPDDTDPLCAGCQIAEVVPSGPCVYRAWDTDGSLLYIGSTIQPVQRIRAHATGTRWWPEVARLTFEEFRTEPEIRVAESTAIWNEPSKYNRGGTRQKATTSLGILAGIEIESTVGDSA